jgi:hypothetical protein
MAVAWPTENKAKGRCICALCIVGWECGTTALEWVKPKEKKKATHFPCQCTIRGLVVVDKETRFAGEGRVQCVLWCVPSRSTWLLPRAS